MERGKGQWDLGRLFQLECVSIFLVIEPKPPTNEKETSHEFRCIPCSWKLGKAMKLYTMLDTIEKYTRKVYDKKIVNGKEKSTIRWKYFEECQHVKYGDEYKKYLRREGKLEANGGAITSLFGKNFSIQYNIIKNCISHLI
jgi:hypothetical protein